MVKRIYSIVTGTLTVLVVLLAVMLAGVRLLGIQPYTVLSGSMEPTYHVGSMIYVKKALPHEFRKGDPITYKFNDGTVVTHRVIEVIHEDSDPTGYCFRTQGDANDTPDGPVLAGVNVIGKPLFSIPYLGYFANFVQTPPGTYYAIAFCAIVAITVFLPDTINLFFGKNDGKDGDKPSGEGASPPPSEEA